MSTSDSKDVVSEKPMIIEPSGATAMEDSHAGDETELGLEKPVEAGDLMVKDGRRKIPLPPPRPSDEHALEHTYSFWFTKRILPMKIAKGESKTKTMSVDDYKHTLKLIGSFATVEQFWSFYCHMLLPHDLAPCETNRAPEDTRPYEVCDYHMFKYGILPLWEDPKNIHGGKNVISINHPDRTLVSRYWENVILAIIGEQFLVGDAIVGAVCAMRPRDADTSRYDMGRGRGINDKISVWTRDASDQLTQRRIGDVLERLAPPELVKRNEALPAKYGYSIAYTRHQDSINSGSKNKGGPLQQPPSFRGENRGFYRGGGGGGGGYAPRSRGGGGRGGFGGGFNRGGAGFSRYGGGGY